MATSGRNSGVANAGYYGKEQPVRYTLAAPQAENLAASMRGMAAYRRALDNVRHDLPGQPLPQPSQFGLRLSDLSSAQVLWRVPR